MPPDVVTIVSTGIGVSVIAGVLSGVCYILAHGFSKKRSRNSVLQWHCVVCGKYLRSYSAENIKVVICIECEERVCKQRCSKRDFARKGWICYNCLKQPSWLHNIFDSITARFQKIEFLRPTVSQSEQMGEHMGSSDPKSNKEKEYVRDFIEKIVSTIVGGSVDDASIFRLYNDKDYDTLFDRYHQQLSNAITDLSSTLHISLSNSPLTETSPSSAHTNLKLLIERILHEASRLPHLRRAADNPTTSSETYEELLATAILNTIISKHENDVSPSSEANIPDENINEEYETWKTNWKQAELETTSTSSIDEYLQSDSSLGSIKYVDHLSLTIQQRIEEIPSTNSVDDTDGSTEYIRLNSSEIPNGHSNWYLQKRPFHGTVSPVPVPMLVPNPLTTAKVLIGDKEIDETSDLSDATSESDTENITSKPQNLMIDSTVVIAGDPFNVASINYFSDEDTSFDSGVRDDRDDFSDREKFYTFGPKSHISIDDENVENVSLISSHHSNMEKDSEYFEKYGSLPKTVLKSVTPHTNFPSSQLTENDATYKILDLKNYYQDERDKKDKNEEDFPVFEGSYSKKEKEKWNHPINMTYNPYSEENIRKRIRTNHIFGRDYYTKQASLPSGRAKSEENDDVFWKRETYSPSEENEESTWYRAIPATTMDNEPESQVEESSTIITPVWKTEDQDTSEATSNSDLSLVNCYDVENSKIYHQTFEEGQKIIEVKINEKEIFFPENDNLSEKPSTRFTDHSSTKLQEENNQSAIYSDNEGPPQVVPRIFTTTDKSITKLPIPTKRNVTNKTFKEILVTENESKPTLLSPTSAGKKLDNTLIKKIYSNPVVRNFALSNREKIPYETNDEVNKFKNTKPANELVTLVNDEKVLMQNTINSEGSFSNSTETSVSRNDGNGEVLTVNNFSLEFSDNGSLKEKHAMYEDDFKELKEKRLVASRLGEFSKSFPNLTKTNVVKRNEELDQKFAEETKGTNIQKRLPTESNVQDITMPQENVISVKHLKKLFEKHDISHYSKDKPVHSLTARSISKQMKQKLKSHQNSDEDNIPNTDELSE